MAFKNTIISYGSVAKFFHWVVFLLVAGLLIVGFTMGNLPASFKEPVYNTHKLVGLSVLTLMILRVFWTIINSKPKMPDKTNWLEKKMRNIVHGFFYLLLLAMPLSGWLMASAAGHPPHFFNLFVLQLPVSNNPQFVSFCHEVHEILAWMIISFGALHVLAGLKHHFIEHDQVLKRMLPRFFVSK